YITIKYPATVQWIDLPFSIFNYSSFPLPLMGLPFLAALTVLLHRKFDRQYVIGPDYVKEVHGLYSLKMRETILEFAKVHGVEIEKNLFQRLFNLGDIGVGSAMTGSTEIIMVGVRDPEKYAKIIEDRVKKYLNYSSEAV
ncbi:MAG: PH domain-containing protein, partial [Candidatus Dadabacteria bacterium]